MARSLCLRLGNYSVEKESLKWTIEIEKYELNTGQYLETSRSAKIFGNIWRKVMQTETLQKN